MSHNPRDGRRTVVPDSAERAFIVDIGAAASRRHAIPAWFDVDVTAVLPHLADRHVTLTTYVVATLARAVSRHPRMHALRDPRGRVVMFSSVDVSVSVEVPIDGELFPMNHVLRGAQARSPDDLQRELHGVKAEPAGSATMAMADKARLFLVLPPAVRSRLLSMMHRLPDLQSRLVGTVGVTSVGMHSTGGGLGLPFLVHTLDVLVGGLDERPGFDDRGNVVAKRMLSIAVVADHDVIDGAPLARFLADFRHDLQHGGMLG